MAKVHGKYLINGSIQENKLAFDIATQLELDAVQNTLTTNITTLQTNVNAELTSLETELKSYADAVGSGLSPKGSVRLMVSAGTTLSGLQTIQGVVIEENDRIAVTQNGVYIASAGTWQRAEDFAQNSSVKGSSFFVEQGTYADRKFVVTNDKGSDIVGTDVINFAVYSSLEHATAEKGIEKSGDTFKLKALSRTSIILNPADITAKEVTLPSTPAFPSDVRLTVSNAPIMINSVDFVIIGDKLNWAGKEIDGLIEAGETITVEYVA